MKYRYRSAFWCAAVLLGFLQIWAHRYDVNPDGVSYIDLAWSGLRHGFPHDLSGLVNAYWGPLYPALLSVAFRLVRPGPAWESTVVHLVNFAIYLANLACFELFLRELLLLRESSPQPPAGRTRLPDELLWTWGYVFFLWACQVWLRPALITPDLCVAAFAYLALAILLRIRRGGGAWPAYLLLGAALGLAYLAKAFMFLLAWPVLVSSIWAAASRRRALPRALAAMLVFLAIAAPEILALSHAKGRWTFSDAGALNYLLYVDRIPGQYGLSVPPRAGAAVHPVRQILDRPRMIEFAGPLLATYPLGFDPTYWYEGAHPYFSLRRQWRATANTLGYFVRIFSTTGALYAVFLVLHLLLRRTGSWSGTGPPQWAVWFPLYAAFGIYGLVYVEARFVGAFALMLLMGLFAAVQPARQRLEGRRSSLTVAMTFVASLAIVWYAGKDLRMLAHPSPVPAFQLARQIGAMGLASADDFANSGRPRELVGVINTDPAPYWAHLAGLRIMAEVPSGAEYWNADPAAQAAVMQKFAALGIRLVVADVPRSSLVANAPMGNALTGNPANGLAQQGWTSVPGTDFYIHRVDAPVGSATTGSASARSPSVSAVNPQVASADPSSNRDISR